MQEITIFITTSPIPVHPYTGIIDRTIASVRHFLPDSPIVIASDGLREQQSHLSEQYEEYKEAIKRRINDGDYGTAQLVEADEHVHQTGLLRLSLPIIQTKYMFWVEHDTPMLTDRDIDFNNILSALEISDYVMFFHLPAIPAEWNVLMYGDTQVDGVRYLKTRHWSSRTNIARKEYYQKCLNMYSPEAKAMFESVPFQIVDNAYIQHSPLRHEHRLLIYAPEENIQHSAHGNGRGKEPTFNELQVF